MAKKQLAINLAANVTAFAIQLGINFFLTPYLIRTVGKEAYSFFPLANSIIGYANIITIALNSMASRYITFKIQQNDVKGANVYFNSVLMGNTVIAVLLTIPSIFFVIFVNHLLNIPPAVLAEVQVLFGLIFAASLISIFASVYGVATFARNRLELSSMRNAESNIIRAVLLVVLFYFFKPSITYIGFANLVVAIFLIVMNMKYTRMLLPELAIHRKYFSFSAIKELISSGVWNSLNQLSNVLMSGLDLLVANLFLGAAASGEFAIAKTVPMFFQSFIAVLVGVFVPELMILYAQSKKSEFRTSLNRSMKFMQILLSIPFGFLMVFGDTFFNLWVPGQNSHLLHQMIILIIAPLIVTTSIETVFHVYTVTNKLKIPALALFITGVINISLMLILVKYTRLGIIAIPLVSLITGIIKHTTFTPIYAARILNEKWTTFYYSIFKGVIAFAAVAVIAYMIKLTINPASWTTFLISFILCAFLSFIINTLITLNRSERAVFQNLITSAFKKFRI
ncbi:MAG: oligosaccharide flippase family protein [bacterium]